MLNSKYNIYKKKPKTRQKPTRYVKVKPLKRKPKKNIKSSQRGGNLFKVD